MVQVDIAPTWCHNLDMANSKMIPITVRFPSKLHKELALEATLANMSINHLVVMKCGGSSLPSLIEESIDRAFERRDMKLQKEG